MSTHKQILSRSCIIISMCVFLLTSCTSAKYTASKYARSGRSYTKSNGKQYRTIPHVNSKLGSVKCSHVKSTNIDPVNLSAGITKNDMENPDLTLIILNEQEIPCHPDTIHHKLKVYKASAEVR